MASLEKLNFLRLSCTGQSIACHRFDLFYDFSKYDSPSCHCLPQNCL